MIYNLAIQAYVFAIRLSAAFGNSKARLWIEGRKDWQTKLKSILKPGEKRIWFHCSSLGEFEQGRPVMEKLKQLKSEYKIVLTFFSPSGYEIRKNYPGADYIFYLPADSQKNAKDFISLISPEKVFFTKYEYWHHYFHELKGNGISLYMVSAIFRPGDRFFKWYGSFFRKMLKCVTHFFVQDETSRELLEQIGFPNSTVAGDTRFDRVVQVASGAKDIPVALQFAGDNHVLVAGSTWAADEKILAEALKLFRGKVKLILAPHEINDERINEVSRAFSDYKVMRYSESTGAIPDEYDILIIDNIGMLSSLYRYGQVAYIGGGFGKGIHNCLEAAVYGIPVFFGPRYEKFNEAKALIASDGARSISTAEELTRDLQLFFGDKSARIKAGNAAQQYVQSNAGATDKILESTVFAIN